MITTYTDIYTTCPNCGKHALTYQYDDDQIQYWYHPGEWLNLCITRTNATTNPT